MCDYWLRMCTTSYVDPYILRRKNISHEAPFESSILEAFHCLQTWLNHTDRLIRPTLFPLCLLHPGLLPYYIFQFCSFEGFLTVPHTWTYALLILPRKCSFLHYQAAFLFSGSSKHLPCSRRGRCATISLGWSSWTILSSSCWLSDKQPALVFTCPLCVGNLHHYLWKKLRDRDRNMGAYIFRRKQAERTNSGERGGIEKAYDIKTGEETLQTQNCLQISEDYYGGKA